MRRSKMRNNLKQLLEERNMTQKDLANMTGLQESTLSRYITGDALGNKYLILLAIADALHVSIDDIISKEN